MKLIDAITNVVRPEARTRWDFTIDTYRLCNALEVPEVWSDADEIDERIKAYPIFNWYCTDEMVGLYAIYFDGEPVGAYFRQGRKCAYEFEWISEEKATSLRNFLLTFTTPEKYDLIDPEEEIDLNALRYWNRDGNLMVEMDDA